MGVKGTVLVILVLVLGLAPAATAGTGGHSVSDCVRTMTSESEPWAERCEAEDSLKTFGADSVLGALLPHVSKGMPSLPIWNSLGREHDREAPVEWQIHYAIARSWRHPLAGAPSEELGALLLELLARAETAFGRQRVLFDLSRHWHPDAEEPLRQLMMDVEQDLTVKLAAGFDLMLHCGKTYHETLLNLAAGSSGDEKREWWNLLVDPRHKSSMGIDPDVVRLGFEVLGEEREARPDYVHGAYFVACKLGGYLDQEFKPDQRRAEYRGTHGLKDSFFADTVDRAVAWWEENRRGYEQASTRP